MSTALLVLLLASACGYGPVLKSFPVECKLESLYMSLNIQLPRGDIELTGYDAPDGVTVTGTLDVYNRGVSGWTFEPAALDDITFSLSGSGDSLQVLLCNEAYKPNFYYILSLKVPDDYLFYSGSAQDANYIKTDEGEITIRNIKGAEMGHRDFDIMAGPPMGAFSHPAMTIENVDGIITASAYGPMTISDCRAVSFIICSGSGDLLDIKLGNTAISEKALIHGTNGGINISLSRDSDFTFYNEVEALGIFPPPAIVNDGEPIISGPVDVEFEYLPKQRIVTGTGDVGIFDVHTVEGRITYELYD